MTRSPAKSAPSSPKPRFRNGIVTPHASFLALRFAPREAMENLRKLKDRFPIYGDHGFMDSVNVSTGVVADRVLMLDQGMIMAAIANALADDAMRTAFVDRHFEQVLRPLMAMEEFTAGGLLSMHPIRPAPRRVTAETIAMSRSFAHHSFHAIKAILGGIVEPKSAEKWRRVCETSAREPLASLS